MKIYLAARYSRREEMRQHRDLLRSLGHEVTSRWLDGDYPTGGDGRSLVAPDKLRLRVAVEDMDDILAANVFVAFTEPGRNDGRGGRHVEFGIALASGRWTVAIGAVENVFYMLAAERYESWTEFVEACFPARYPAS